MIELLKETARYIVCVKPAGIAAQGTQQEAMPQLLSAQLGCEIFPVHRLDQTVGGVMVFARSRMADSLLSRQVQAHTFEKDYLAVLEGVPAQASGVLEDQLRRDTAARRTCASPRRVVRRVSSTGESHRTSQKGTSAPAHRFTTRSGQPLSIWTST